MEKVTITIHGTERQAWEVGPYLVMHSMSKHCPDVQLGPYAGMYFPHGAQLTEVWSRTPLELVAHFDSIGKGIVWATWKSKERKRQNRVT